MTEPAISFVGVWTALLAAGVFFYVLLDGFASDEVEWPARLQRLRGGALVALAPPQAEVWLDGAHNEAGGRALAEALADLEDHAPRPLVLICGTLASKDTAGFLGHFKGLAQETLAVPIVGEHAARPAEEVAAIAQSVGLEAAACDGVASALEIPGGAHLADAAAHLDRRLALSGRRSVGSQRRRAALRRPERRQLSPLAGSFALAVVRPCSRSMAAMSCASLARVGRHVGVGAGLLVFAVLQMAGERGLALAVDLALEVVGNGFAAP